MGNSVLALEHENKAAQRELQAARLAQNALKSELSRHVELLFSVDDKRCCQCTWSHNLYRILPFEQRLPELPALIHKRNLASTVAGMVDDGLHRLLRLAVRDGHEEVEGKRIALLLLFRDNGVQLIAFA